MNHQQLNLNQAEIVGNDFEGESTPIKNPFDMSSYSLEALNPSPAPQRSQPPLQDHKYVRMDEELDQAIREHQRGLNEQNPFPRPPDTAWESFKAFFKKPKTQDLTYFPKGPQAYELQKLEPGQPDYRGTGNMATPNAPITRAGYTNGGRGTHDLDRSLGFRDVNGNAAEQWDVEKIFWASVVCCCCCL